jgi:hypothetical protein
MRTFTTEAVSWLGNPYTVKKYNRQTAIEKYQEVFHDRIESDPAFRAAVDSLQGQTLGCWCRPRDCHGDVIVDYLEQ